MSVLYVWDREVVDAGDRCPCGEVREVRDVDHHMKTGNKIVRVRCRGCMTDKRLVETFRRR